MSSSEAKTGAPYQDTKGVWHFPYKTDQSGVGREIMIKADTLEEALPMAIQILNAKAAQSGK